MKTKNNYPTSEFEAKDRCPSCGSYCNIFTDLDENDNCNDCRKINSTENIFSINDILEAKDLILKILTGIEKNMVINVLDNMINTKATVSGCTGYLK